MVATKTIAVDVTAREINEGMGYFVRAYRIRPISNTQEQMTKKAEIKVDEEIIEKVRSIMKIFEKTFQFIIIEWEHPNYGYFADAGFYWRSMHSGEWILVPIVNWMSEYKDYKMFIKKYPEFKDLFEDK